MKWDEQTDVIVIGSGVAGCSAAIEARRAGASVLVLEKMKITGGNTRISDGSLAAPENYLQQERGVRDSKERFYRDMLEAGLGINHPELVRIVADRAARDVDWLRVELGVRFMDRLDRFGGHSAERGLTTVSHSGVDIVKAQIAELGRIGVEIRTRCQMTALLAGDDGGIQGVCIRAGYNHRDETFEKTQNVRARRAVILASGGFGSDIAFRGLQNPRLDASVGSSNHRGATAEGLIAGLRIGAAPVHLSWIQTGPWGCVDEPGYGRGGRFASYSVYPCGILIDPATGCRIVNEWAGRRVRSNALFDAGHPCVGVVDAQGAEKEPESLDICLKSGKIHPFENFRELADYYAMPSDQVQATVERYNRMIRQARTDQFGKPLETAQPLETPPFYALRLWPKVHYTPGGVGINADARVIDLNGKPIVNLYAAGEVCGGVHGADRLGSCALTESLVFGRIAGRNAAS